MKYEKLLPQLTLEEKIALLSGTNFMETNPIPRLGIPGLSMADGPHGVRKQTGSPEHGVSYSEPATAFPTAAGLASSWNVDNARRMGEAIAAEARHHGVHILLGPGVNIKRNPRCGRNFEYFSEDPLLAGALGVAFVQGVQSRGVGVSVKHFAANNQENFRYMGESVVDERALREIYLKPFEMIVKDAAPYTIMCAYNKLWGEYCSENRRLLTDVLRDEWGFDGVVMTDWGAAKDRAKGVAAGLDLEMPGDTPYGRRRLLDAVKDGTLPLEVLDRAVRNMLRLIDKCTAGPGGLDGPGQPVDWDSHHRLAAEIATDGAVLLQNDGTLPLDRSERLLVVGDLFENMRYQGSGSSMVNPTKLTTPKDAFDARGVEYTFVRGYDAGAPSAGETAFGPATSARVQEAVRQAEHAHVIVVFAGLTDYIETEAGDRADMRLPAEQLRLLDALAAVGKPVVVVLFGGAPVEAPFAGKVQAVLNMYLPGQNGGEAAAALLFGEANPGGKLAETWPETAEDVPFDGKYSTGPVEVYRESVFVGYRYYATAGKKPRWPFGHGLSYTRFSYSNLQLEQIDGVVTATCDVTNGGERAGAEVVQLYVRPPESRWPRPVKELRAFAKLTLQPGETKTATLTFAVGDLALYDVRSRRRILEAGEYVVEVGSSSEDIRLRRDLSVAATPIPVSDPKTEGEPASGQPGAGQPKAEPTPVAQWPEEVLRAYSDWADFDVPDGAFEQLLGRSVPDPPPPLPLTMESPFTDFRRTFFGRIVFSIAMSVAGRLERQARRLPPGKERDNRLKGALFMGKIVSTSSPRSLTMAGPDSLPYHWAEAFVELGNGRLLSALKRFFTPVKVPPLPKER